MAEPHSFDCRKGLRRLLSRCPLLRDEPMVSSLLIREYEINEEDVLTAVECLLLRPNITVVVAGCFRQVLPKLVSRVINTLRKLSSNVQISHFQWNLSTREYVSIAFSQILELQPYLLSAFLEYYAFAPPVFERLLYSNSVEKGMPDLIEVIRAAYRFLLLEPKVFRDLWDWSPFVDLLQWTSRVERHLVSDVRWCAIQVLSLVFRMNDAATRELSSSICNLTEQETFQCLRRWEEFSQEIAVEKASVFVEFGCQDQEDALSNCGSQIPNQTSTALKWKHEKDGRISSIEVCGIDLPVRHCLEKSRTSLVLTPSLEASFRAIALALTECRPILLEGALGCGKTSLIQELAHLTGNADAVFIHLDDQMDSKVLLGTYVCTEVPGEFKWQPGALTQAVSKGLWVVFEDIDKAPSEIFSVLGPLLEDRMLYIPGRGEKIYAAGNFRLFSTITRMKFGSTHASPYGGKEVANYSWRKIVVPSPSDEELATILQERFLSLSSLIPKLIGTFNRVKDIASQSSAGGISIHVGRQYSIRDIIKWCKRIAGLVNSPVLQDSIKDQIFLEALDCFTGSIPNAADSQLVRAIAEMWGIPMQRVEYFGHLYKPAFQVLESGLQIGHAILTRAHQTTKVHPRLFANTGHFVRLLERIGKCVQNQEPVLLVGETGTGKTTLVQQLAFHLSVPLTIVNLSQQSDSADFLGGFKPVESHSICLPLFDTFIQLFRRTFPSQQNSKYLLRVQKFVERKDWTNLLKAFHTAVGKVSKLNQSCAEHSPKRRRALSPEKSEAWQAFSVSLSQADRQIESAKGAFAFSFVEGALIRALKNGHWLLLDEINLAPGEALERLNGIVDGEMGSVCLTERGDLENIPRHANFRVFACMNPATDVGKRDLPILLRNRFTEIYVDELSFKDDLHSLVFQYLEGALPNPPVEDIVDFYLRARSEADARLLDGAGQRPQYSLRSLTRALEFTRDSMPIYGFYRALYDGVCMSFCTLLEHSSRIIMEKLIMSTLLRNASSSKGFSQLLTKLPNQPSVNHVAIGQFWLEAGPEARTESSFQHYILTESVNEHLKNLARAVFVRKYPILLQGPTSSGKTSLVEYLAIKTGHPFVRINNHEHTDLQEYLGTYMTDSTGKLVFQEGILVEAVRKGYWIVLDELNLAPSDVLEALNRLLDDNRELFVPELQVTVKPHPHFMLFATQNPPGIYGGRKVLSRAFRNRFMELHVDDIPDNELCTILEKRCALPSSYAKKMVEVMKDLQRHRQGSKVFAGKHGFITPRDLFRWAERHKKQGISYEDLAWSGYLLLAERLRDENEKLIVQKTIEKHMRVKLEVTRIYNEFFNSPRLERLQSLKESPNMSSFGEIVWTKSMRRLFYLLEQSYDHQEPVLLVGETGCGKTTVCQLLSLSLGEHLHIINCHQHTETSDFLGGFRPVRDRENAALKYKHILSQLMQTSLFQGHLIDQISFKIEDSASTLPIIRNALKDAKSKIAESDDPVSQEMKMVEEHERQLTGLQRDWQSLFVWHDGPLVEAMRNGDLFLIDEISLADDSVLERLNSVLETKRTLVLAEKGGSCLEHIIAHPKFRLFATMNPGGDFGKKELSPALRNRFTEIWVPPVTDDDDLRSIVLNRIPRNHLSCLVDPLLEFWKWFQDNQENGKLLSIRDLLSWVLFIKNAHKDIGKYPAFLHGAFLVLLDGLQLGTGLSSGSAAHLKDNCVKYLLQMLPEDAKGEVSDTLLNKNRRTLSKIKYQTTDERESRWKVGIHPFYIEIGPSSVDDSHFAFDAPTTCNNALRIFRAMQLKKPVLIEGSPGVGKTSLVTAIAQHSGHPLVRINLSEQTDIMDLFGSELPIEGGRGGEFQWSDGIFLKALKDGSWILLDELNLASQSVLEGLNSCLDHRGEVFIPELGQTFKCSTSFRVFGCQNPLNEGGGRKGLPKSFLNRFTKVFVETLSHADFLFISHSLHPSIPEELLAKMVKFNAIVHEKIMINHEFGQSGSPWEFNLRDILRWCRLIEETSSLDGIEAAAYFLDVIYLQRLRAKEDRFYTKRLFQDVFGISPEFNIPPEVAITPRGLRVGHANLERTLYSWNEKDVSKQLCLLPGFTKRLECMMHCIQQNWMCILVGPSKTGKTSLVRWLANITGNILHELPLSSATDTTELLGCFEQHDNARHWQELTSEAHSVLTLACVVILTATHASSMGAERKVAAVKSILDGWAALRKQGVVVKGLEVSEVEKRVKMLIQILRQVKQVTSNFVSELDLVTCLQKLEASLEKFQRMLKQSNSRQFEWVDGDLVRALERGEWVLLENANFCNPTVLDRLNSLVEPSGNITINERGLVDGQAMTISASSNFRLFLTVDTSHGEASRAMRNRGVEIYMMHPDMVAPKEGLVKESTITCQDMKRVVISAGIPSMVLVEAICRTHTKMVQMAEKACGFHAVSLKELSLWVNLFCILLEKGFNLPWSLKCSWEQLYLVYFDSVNDREAAKDVFHCHFSDVLSFQQFAGAPLYVPGGWPRPLCLRDYCWRSVESTIRQDGMFFENLSVSVLAWNMHNHCQQLSHDKKEKVDFVRSAKDIAPFLPVGLFRALLYSESDMSSCMPGDDVGISARMLHHAARWVLEQAALSTTQHYLQWLHYLSVKTGKYCSTLRFIALVLEKEISHPLSTFCSKYVSSNSLCKQENLFQAAFGTTDIANCARRLICMRESIFQWALEDMVLENALKDGPHGSATLIELSYFNHLQILRPYSIPDYQKIVLWLYPFLCSLRRFEDYVLTIVGFDMLLKAKYKEVLNWHKHLWESANTNNFQFDGFLFCWKSLTHSLSEVRPYTNDEVWRTLSSSMQLLNEGLESRSPYSPPYLWKFGGHPRMARTEELYELNMKVVACIRTVWVDSKQTGMQSKNRVLAVDATTRSLVLDGISMIMLLAEIGSNSTALGGMLPLGDIGIECCEIQETLSDKLQSLKVPELNNCDLIPVVRQVFQSTDLQDTVLDMKMPVSSCYPLEFLRWPAGQECWQQLVSLADYFSLSCDAEILGNILPNVADFTCGIASSNLMSSCEASVDLIRWAIEFHILSSARAPLDFVPHQHLLWILEKKDPETASFVVDKIHDLLFKWHKGLWENANAIAESQSHSQTFSGWPATSGPCRLFQASEAFLTSKILDIDLIPVKDYHIKLHQLRVALSYSLLFGKHELHGTFNADLRRARAIFQQIIYAHKKAFSKDLMDELKSTFHSLDKDSQNVRENSVLVSRIISLIRLSRHTSLVGAIDSLLLPCMNILYSTFWAEISFHGQLALHGHLWVHIGRLRLWLLMSSLDHDPMSKYIFKEKCLSDRVSDIDIEISVREQSNLLVKGTKVSMDVQRVMEERDGLHKNLQVVRSKVVFRPGTSQYAQMYETLNQFLKMAANDDRISGLVKLLLVTEPSHEDLSRTVEEVNVWQDTMASFASQLSSQFPPYYDIFQPILLGIYELKYGFSLMVGAQVHSTTLKQMRSNLADVLKIISVLMEFPTRVMFNNDCLVVGTERSEENTRKRVDGFTYELLSCDGLITEEAFNIIRLVAGSHSATNQKWEELKMQILLMHIALLRCTQDIMLSKITTTRTLKILWDIFSSIVRIWREVRNERIEKDERESQVFRLRTSNHKLGMEFEMDEASLHQMFPSYWPDGMMDFDLYATAAASPEGMAVSELASETVQESAFLSLADMHSRIFMLCAGECAPSDCSVFKMNHDAFVAAYNMGKKIIAAIGYALPKSVDACAVSAYITSMGLEIQKLQPVSQKSEENMLFNIYKDPNPSELARMLAPLSSLIKRAVYLLEEWPENATLQQIIYFSEKLISISIDSPLMKALTMLEHIITKARLWEDNAPKHLSFEDGLKQSCLVAMHWRQMELSSWPALLRIKYKEHESNADKLWFPLYDVLHQCVGGNAEDIVKSIEDFLLTSPIGEFQRRLKIVRGFYGEFTMLTSSDAAVIRDILYNIYYYCSQFESLISRALSSGKEAIEKELIALVHLSRWEDHDYRDLAAIKRPHKKLHDLVHKYEVLLKGPVVGILRSQSPTSINASANQCTVDADNESTGKVLSHAEDSVNSLTLQARLTMAWQGYLAKMQPELTASMETLYGGRNGSKLAEYCKGLHTLIPKVYSLLASHMFLERSCTLRQEGSFTLEALSTTVVSRATELRESCSNRSIKKKAFVDLLKELKAIGISHHQSSIPKDERNVKSWFMQPMAQVDDVLQCIERGPWASESVVYKTSEYTSKMWKQARQYYYCNIQLIQQLYDNTLSHSKDLSQREVKLSTRYVENLLHLQRRQRRKAHNFYIKMVQIFSLTSYLKSLEKGDDAMVLVPYQTLLRKYLWQQKHLLDWVCKVSSDMELLLVSLESVDKSGSFKLAILGILKPLQSCKEEVDQVLVPGTITFVAEATSLHFPVLLTNTMLDLLERNFRAIREGMSALTNFRGNCMWSSGCNGIGLNNLVDLLQKGVALHIRFEEDRTHFLQENALSKIDLDAIYSCYENVVSESLKASQNIHKTTISVLEADSLQNIQTWEAQLDNLMLALRLDCVHESAFAAISKGVSALNQMGGNNEAQQCIGFTFRSILLFLEPLQISALHILMEYSCMHKALTKLGYILSSIFKDLFCEGFCGTKAEERTDDTSKLEEATGTGMGEGEGANDVSKDIADEEQLLGTSGEQASESKMPQKSADEGVEMDQDFHGDIFDVSDDESDADDNDDHDATTKLESEMGESGPNDEIVDEKFWNEGDASENKDNNPEKYEKDAPFAGVDHELRAKESEQKGNNDDETAENEARVDDNNRKEEYSQDGNEDDHIMNQNEACEESSKMKPWDEEKLENMNLDEKEEKDHEEEDHASENPDENTPKCADDEEPTEEKPNTNGDAKPGMEHDDGQNNIEEGNIEASDKLESMQDEIQHDEESDKLESMQDEMEHDDFEKRAAKRNKDSQQKHTEMPHLDTVEKNNCSSRSNIVDADVFGVLSNLNTDPFPSDANGDVSLQAVLQGLTVADKIQKASGSEESLNVNYAPFSDNPPYLPEEQSLKHLETNPFRSLGDALKTWKERVKIFDEDKTEAMVDAPRMEENDVLDEHEDQTNRDYRYVADHEAASDQALGAATDDQLQCSGKLEEILDEEAMMIDRDLQTAETEKNGDPIALKDTLSHDGNQVASFKKHIQDEKDHLEVALDPEQDEAMDVGDQGLGNSAESTLSLDKDFALYKSCLRYDGPSAWSDNDIERLRKELELSLLEGCKNNAKELWHRYEMLTRRLSQNLAEQLRLILEPTMAAKLQGDYKSGKRINMKKVISYIATEFRKDKIWLRRTKASKRQYQVVLAIDDSRSMSESHCGHMALEALITICRAMSFLEIGQLAVASYGRKGNVRLLHDFDRPFSSEAGERIISEFSFKQDNTIAEEPMVDLLRFLTQMLQSVALQAPSSGQDCLQQLVIIISDGRFHEKENLRRCVRDAISQKQLLAFLVLDNPQESLLDMQTVTYSKGAPVFSKYLDSFPFPYYVLLRDIEALPRTLADLLRQWFELVQVIGS